MDPTLPSGYSLRTFFNSASIINLPSLFALLLDNFNHNESTLPPFSAVSLVYTEFDQVISAAFVLERRFTQLPQADTYLVGYVCTTPNHRRHGLAAKALHSLFSQYPHGTFIIHSESSAIPFYHNIGATVVSNQGVYIDDNGHFLTPDNDPVFIYPPSATDQYFNVPFQLGGVW